MRDLFAVFKMSLTVGVFCLTLFIVAISADECPSGFLRHGDSCYNLVRVKASWAEATVYCSAVGAHLAVIESDGEQSYIKAHLIQESSTIDTSGVWIGGLDYREEGIWEWGFGTGLIDKKWWGPNDPDNHRSGNTGQDCLMLYKSQHYTWDDHFCSQKEYFLCEVERPVGAQIVG